MKQFLLLVGVIAVVMGALLCSLYVLDLVKLSDLLMNLRRVLGLTGIAAAAGVLIMLLVKVAQK